MSAAFRISEETPDREYFTIVPNYIVNHSTIWEQGIYLVMKRIAGERGSCYATHQTISEKLGISRPTVSKTIIKLLGRDWLKEIGTKPGKTHPVKEYQVVDLWQMNIDYYQNQKIRKPQNISTDSGKDTSTTEHKIGSLVYIEEEHKNKKNKSSDLIRIKSSDLVDDEFGNSVVNLTPRKRKPSNLPLMRILSCLENTLKTKIVNIGKQARAWKMMEKAGYTEAQVCRTIQHMAERDEFFQGKGFDLATVMNQIPRYKAMAESSASERRKEEYISPLASTED